MSEIHNQMDITEAVLLTLLDASVESMEKIHAEATEDNNFIIYEVSLDANEWNHANVEMANFIMTNFIEPLESIGSDVTTAAMKLEELLSIKAEKEIEFKLVIGEKI